MCLWFSLPLYLLTYKECVVLSVLAYTLLLEKPKTIMTNYRSRYERKIIFRDSNCCKICWRRDTESSYHKHAAAAALLFNVVFLGGGCACRLLWSPKKVSAIMQTIINSGDGFVRIKVCFYLLREVAKQCWVQAKAVFMCSYEFVSKFDDEFTVEQFEWVFNEEGDLARDECSND